MAHPLLFDLYPEVAGTIPWVPLGTFPTPVERLTQLGEKLEYPDLWVKRDDLSSDKMGGNKVRVMEFLLAEAKAQGKTRAISPGALGSNQIMASAIYGNQLGIDIIGIFFKQCDTDYMRKHMLVDRSMGVKFHYVNNPYLILFYIFYYYLRYTNWKKMEGPFYIPTFGSSATCTLGYINAMIELKHQIDAGEMPEPDIIFVTAGTGGTMAGIEFGARALNLKSKVVGVRIADYVATNEIMLKSILHRAYKHMRKAGAQVPRLKWKRKDITLIHDYFGGEYAKITPEALAAKKTCHELDGITLYTTYTAKTMAAMIEYLTANDLRDKTILFWHTYNTRDLSPFLNESIDYRTLPEEFHPYFMNSF